MQIARYQTGTEEMHQVVTVTQNAENLYTVRNWEMCEGQQSEVKFSDYANAALAFRAALRIVAAEVEDVVDTFEG